MHVDALHNLSFLCQHCLLWQLAVFKSYVSAVCDWRRTSSCWLATLARTHVMLLAGSCAYLQDATGLFGRASSFSWVSLPSFDLCSLCSQWITSWAIYVRHVVQRFTWDEQFVDATLHSHLQSGNNNYVVRKQWNTEERIKLMWETLKHLSNCSNRYPLVQLACDMARNWLAG